MSARAAGPLPFQRPVSSPVFSFSNVSVRFLYADPDLSAATSGLSDVLDQFVQQQSGSTPPLTLVVRRHGSVVRATEETPGGASWAFPRGGNLAVYLEWVVHQVVTNRLLDAIGIHAGAVGPGDRPILLVGESGAGKSTLVMQLVQRGWRYWSDDLAALDLVTGHCRPYPKSLKFEGPTPLRLHYSRGTVLRVRYYGKCARRYVRVWRISGFRWGQPAPVAGVVMLGHRRTGPPTVTALSPGQTVEVLGQHARIHKDRQSAGLEILCRLAETTPGVRLDLGHSLSDNVRAVQHFAERTGGITP